MSLLRNRCSSRSKECGLVVLQKCFPMSMRNESNRFGCSDCDCGIRSTDGLDGVNHLFMPRVRIGFQGATIASGLSACSLLRDTKIIEKLRTEVGQDAVDFGNIPLLTKTSSKSSSCPEYLASLESYCDEVQRLNPKLKKTNVMDVALNSKTIAESTSLILKTGRIAVTLGGDNSISIGTISAASEAYADLAVLWIDARLNIESVLTSTGSLARMPMAFILEGMRAFMPKQNGFSWVNRLIPTPNVAYFATRDVKPAEKLLLDRIGIGVMDMKDIEHLGIPTAINSALNHISPDRSRPIHVCFDVSAMDDLEIPCTSSPISGGLTCREGITIMEALYAFGMTVSMDVVEFDPNIGSPEDVQRSAKIIFSLLMAAFGGNRGGIANPNLTGSTLLLQ